MIKKKKIFVVDDDLAILEAITTLLEDESYEVKGCSSAQQILNKVTTYFPDVILLDVLLSGDDGRNIAQLIKTNKDTKQIPIILLSAHNGMEKTINSHIADAFIAKPFDINDLLAQVRKLAFRELP